MSFWSGRRIRRLDALFFVLGLAAAGCVFDRADAPRPLGSLKISAGGTQHGISGSPLPDDLVISVLDVTGVPVPNVHVVWEAADGGVIKPLSQATDTEGRAAARWTLGPTGGNHIARVRADGFPTVEIIARTPRISPLPADDIHLLRIDTYDGSNQTVHPDYARITTDAAWDTRDFLAITPYPNANFSFENPSLYQSQDFVDWQTPPGAINPVVLPPPGGYLSDPDVVFDPDRSELMLYYREVIDENSIYMMRTPDAHTWTEPVLVARAANHDIVSPSVVRRSANDWLMWSVNTNIGCPAETTTLELRRSTDGVRWSGPQTTSLSPGSLFPWHVDVQWVEGANQFWALFNAKPAFSCTTTELYLATSPDGVRWTTYPNPVLSRGAIPAFADIVYRATFAYDPSNDAITFWYSGARFDGSRFVWSSAVQQRNRLDVVRDASQPRTANAFTAALRRGVPALTDPP